MTTFATDVNDAATGPRSSSRLAARPRRTYGDSEADKKFDKDLRKGDSKALVVHGTTTSQDFSVVAARAGDYRDRTREWSRGGESEQTLSTVSRRASRKDCPAGTGTLADALPCA